jgi:teichuronic acid biosynthesis glycosyltransferase TuaC
MNVLTFSSLWPNPVQPLHGLFVRARIRALAELCSLKVVAPVPWFVPVRGLGQRYYGYTQVPLHERQEALTVFHPRYLVLPKIMKWSDGYFMFASLSQTINRLRQEFAFDLIDAHWAYPDGYAASLIARKLRLPFTVTVRGNDMTVFAQDRFRRILIRRALMDAQRVICVARSLQELVIDLGVQRQKTVVIENGIDALTFYPIRRDEARSKLNLPQDIQIIVSIGHLIERKGFHLLIEAVRRLIKTRRPSAPLLKFFIVGGEAAGDWDSYCEVLTRQISEFKLQDLVELVGPKNPDELKYWYSAADVFCLASSREGCPNVVLESLACGIPVVATAVSGTPDIISSPEVGILVERNVDSIQLGISDALNRAWDRDHIAQYAHSRYSWKKTAATVYSVFENITPPPKR